MSLPTPSGDPTGFAAGVVLFSGALFTAIDPTGTLGGRWQPVIQAAVALAALGWARRHAWRPLRVWQAAIEARSSERLRSAVERGHAALAERRRSRGVERGATDLEVALVAGVVTFLVVLFLLSFS